MRILCLKLIAPSPPANQTCHHANERLELNFRPLRTGDHVSPHQSVPRIQSRFPAYSPEIHLLQGLCKKLGSEADPTHRTVEVSQFSKQPAFLCPKRIFICLMGAHWTAHHNQSVHLIRIRYAAPLIKTPDIQTQAPRFGLNCNRPRVLPRRVL